MLIAVAGTFRLAYYVDMDGKKYCAKHSKDIPAGRAGESSMMMDVTCSLVSQFFADEFNKKLAGLGRSETVKYAAVFLVERTTPLAAWDTKSLPTSDNTSFWFFEELLDGDFQRFSNNFDYIEPGEELAQAFSHFTYAYSLQQRWPAMLVCDVQGVSAARRCC